MPVLQVEDVARSIEWYGQVLSFAADPFPDEPPYSFAILRRDHSEIMLQLARAVAKEKSEAGRGLGWSVYLRVDGELLRLADAARRHTPLLRGPERMFYGLVELELQDPDGHRICVAEELPAHVGVPTASD